MGNPLDNDFAREQVLSKEAEVDKKVAEWHDSSGLDMPLYEYLGWTWEQYKHWVETSKLP